MNFRTVLCLFCLLLAFAPARDYFGNEASLNQKRLPVISSNPVINAYFTGNKSSLPTKLKRAHQKLNLQHLMTPSGLHLASAIFLLSLFSRKGVFLFGSLLVLGAVLFPYSGIASLKRMILFGLIRKNPIKEISLSGSFFLTFLLCFLFGQYFENPLSFTLSFAFLGALITSPNKFSMFLFLIIIQALLSHWLGKTLDPLGAPLGLVLSLMSSILFPLLAIELIIPSLPVSELWSTLLENLADLCRLSFKLPFFSLFPLFLFFPKIRMRKPVLLLCLLFFVTPLGRGKKSLPFKTPPPRDFQRKVALKNGTKFLYANGMRCYSRLKEDQWSHHCYK